VVVAPDGTVLWQAAPDNGFVHDGPSTGTAWAAEREILAFVDGDGNAWIAGPDVPARQVTQFPAPAMLKQEPKFVGYPSTGGAQVPALLLEPEGFVPGKNPAVVWVHGGPTQSAITDVQIDLCMPYFHTLLDAGFVIIMPDYRGSTDHGEAWEWVLSEDRGVVDVEDVAAAKEHLVTNGLAAPDKVAVVGYSYGGYLTSMASARFAGEWACSATLWGMFDPKHQPLAWTEDGKELPDLSERNPLNLLHRATAPFFIAHGLQDNIATTEEIDRVRGLMESNAVSCHVHLFDDTHGLNRHRNEVARLLVEFFKENML
jgi:dipeptidyl aminopeptidase/acylaminoacyl peptidase